MSGLGVMDRQERAAFRRLPASAQLVILDELAYDPSQADAIRSLLREPNPTKAVADQIAAEVTAATYNVPLSDVGLGRSWKKAFKKVVSKVVEAPKKVYEKAKETINLKNTVAYALAPATAGASLLITDKGREALKKASGYIKTYGPAALSIAGIIAAPFTGGATLALPALVQGYQTVKANKAKAKELAAQGAAEAQAATDAVAQQEAQAAAEIDAFYTQNQALFTNAGYPPEVWATMTVDEKYATLNKLQGAAEAVANDVASGYELAATYKPPAASSEPPQALPAVKATASEAAKADGGGFPLWILAVPVVAYAASR